MTVIKMDILKLINQIYPRRLRRFLNKKYFDYRKATWRSRPLPDFLIIGAQKSGTTSLHNFLIQHPHLVASPITKEIYFFSTHKLDSKEFYTNGEVWYRAHFPRRKEIGAYSKVFESTPDYLFHPLAPERIFKMIPEVKLIALLRNPTERAISQYFMKKAKNRETLSMLEAFKIEEYRLEKIIGQGDYTNSTFTDQSYKSRGLYAEQLERFFRYFPKSQILILSSEEFFLTPNNTLKLIFDFVGVDGDFSVNDVTPRNVGKNKHEVPPGVREYLDDYFRKPNQALYKLLGKDFGW